MKHKIAFYSEVDKLEPWKKLLLKKNIELLAWPSKKDSFKDIEAIIAWNPPKHIWSEFPKLRLIQSLGAGVDHILKKNPPINIKICKLVDPELTTQMAHYAVLSILMCHRNIHHNIVFQKNRIWKQLQHKSTSQTIILILGYGSIGQSIAKYLLPLEFKIKVWKQTATLDSKFSNIKVYFGDKQLDNALKNADIIISTLPSTNKTINLFNFKKFTRFKNNAYFINIGRGDTVIENDLIKALNENILEGAILDVFKNEPLNSDSKLWHHPKVIITPHVAGLTKPSLNNAENFYKNFLSINNNTDPIGLIDREKGY